MEDNNKVKEQPEVGISELFLVSFLDVVPIPYTHYKQTNSRTVTFYYPKSDELEEACARFINKSGSAVEALTLLESYRNIKNIAFDVKKGKVQ